MGKIVKLNDLRPVRGRKLFIPRSQLAGPPVQIRPFSTSIRSLLVLNPGALGPQVDRSMSYSAVDMIILQTEDVKDKYLCSPGGRCSNIFNGIPYRGGMGG